jgi:hypothetical protein
MDAPEMGFLPPITRALRSDCGLPGSDVTVIISRELHPPMASTNADTMLDTVNIEKEILKRSDRTRHSPSAV